MSPGGANAHIAGPVRGAPHLHEALPFLVEREQLLVLRPLDYAEDAPGDVIVDGRHLAGAPRERDDRERSVGLGVQEVAAVVVGVSDPLLNREHVRRRETPVELVRDDPGGLVPVGVPAHRGPNAPHEPVERSLRAGGHVCTDPELAANSSRAATSKQATKPVVCRMF
jgi:hypothetical protein